MRSTTLEIGARKYELRATWAAGEAIEKDCRMDPMRIAQESQMAEAFAQRGLPYNARFHFDMRSTFAILRAGIKAGADDISDDDLKEGMLEIGMEAAGAAAIEFLSLYITNGPTEKGDGEAESGDAKPGE